MKKRICVIVNPISGGIEKEPLVKQIAHRLDPARYDVEIVFTQGPKHATILAQEALRKKADTIAVVGGDGTVNEVGHALVGSSAALAIIPTGSGNGLARHLRIPLDSAKAIDILEAGKIKTIDTVRINDKVYVGVAGIGFDAQVGWAFAAAGRRGFVTYFTTVLKELFRYRPCTNVLSLDGESITREAFLISFANSSQFGNGAAISPQAQIDDGLVDVVILRKFPFYALVQMVYRLFRHSLHRSKYVEIIRCKKIAIAEKHLKAHIDGEPVVFEEGIHIEVIPSSLQVMTRGD